MVVPDLVLPGNEPAEPLKADVGIELVYGRCVQLVVLLEFSGLNCLSVDAYRWSPSKLMDGAAHRQMANAMKKKHLL